MSLFQCEACGCCENTALSSLASKHIPDSFDWSGIENRKGKALCSACGPVKYRNGNQSMNIELLEVIMGATILMAILGSLFSKKLLSIIHIIPPTRITMLVIFMIAICGLMSGFFLVMGYVVSTESGIHDRLIHLRGAYALAVAASCALIAFLWRLDAVARQHNN